MTQIKEQVRAFIVDNFLFGSDEGLTDDGSFLDAGIIDSTGVLELVTFIETTYHIAVDDDELDPENLDSLSSVVSFIKTKQNGKGS